MTNSSVKYEVFVKQYLRATLDISEFLKSISLVTFYTKISQVLIFLIILTKAWRTAAFRYAEIVKIETKIRKKSAFLNRTESRTLLNKLPI